MTRVAMPARRRPTLRRLSADRGGVALTEFALAFPIVLAIGCWGIELSSYALVNLRVSQYALNLADHAGRVGQDASGGITQFREADANDVLQGAKLEGQAIGLTTNGRITLSSLENIKQSYDTTQVQRIHWQRCLGAMSGTNYDSTYGTTAVTDGTDNSQANDGTPVPNGMGDPNYQVKAPTDSGVMFVEVNYQYQPIFGTLYMGTTPRIVHYIASFIVRDNRSYAQIYNPDPKPVKLTCDKHTA